MATLPTRTRSPRDKGKVETLTPYSQGLYGDPLCDILLPRFQPLIERVTECKMHPVTSFARIYGPDSLLKRHTDWFMLELTCSLSVSAEPDRPWPIFLEKDGKELSLELSVGDMVVFRGSEMPHWRTKYEGKRALMVFLHYLDQNGPNAEWKYDKRRFLGSSNVLEKKNGKFVLRSALRRKLSRVMDVLNTKD
ncbi:MAG: hypothetical protein F6K07_33060 [Okeania sp. SIO1H5]|nr:hypothetical protein [Okeania sp. SIO1H5]